MGLCTRMKQTTIIPHVKHISAYIGVHYNTSAYTKSSGVALCQKCGYARGIGVCGVGRTRDECAPGCGFSGAAGRATRGQRLSRRVLRKRQLSTDFASVFVVSLCVCVCVAQTFSPSWLCWAHAMWVAAYDGVCVLGARRIPESKTTATRATRRPADRLMNQTAQLLLFRRIHCP